jgi:hypothetical protein
VPHEDGSLSTNGDDGSLIRGDGDLKDVTGVTDTLVVVDALIVVPNLDSLVLATGDEVLSSLGNSQGVDLSSIRAVEHSDGLSIEAVPVGDLSVAASGKHLRLVWVIYYLLEHSGLEEAHDSSAVNDVPNDGRSII